MNVKTRAVGRTLIARSALKLFLAAILLASSSMADAATIRGKNGFHCDTTPDAQNKSGGWFPIDVGIYLNEGKKTALVIDDLNLRDGKGAVIAKKKIDSKGQHRLSWRVTFKTTEAYKMSGIVTVWFDPSSKTGRIKTSLPARLSNGGIGTGTLTCKPTNFEFLPLGY